ncbi:MAG: hypothetical protein QW507_00250 [Candidatus Nanoarchaeia archaeon]|nr:hypothetical protein [Candidatus Haiyanarchaeum thermophilum]MCW1302988.1 hypothetical protein [Candidatus Haiyanarchaeum thermophilum]MCW1303666.1 hypothetical protein [Candidatus Haiyanarchaeum thermophilum]MCW1306346.1 hypothetical protein [Candidatus Haiyanarchaeum thermophilum]MCW1307144.1 hypothetical protein [Candidatus Haiyanarchaeum thermophilum]
MEETLQEEYGGKVRAIKEWLKQKLGDNYPAKIYMFDPRVVGDAEVISQLCGKLTLFCLIDENHTPDDAIPLERILKQVEIELIGKEDRDGLVKVYDGGFSKPPEISLWAILEKKGIAKKTAQKYMEMGLKTSASAIQIVLDNVSRKPEKAKKLIEEQLRQGSLEKYIA